MAKGPLTLWAFCSFLFLPNATQLTMNDKWLEEKVLISMKQRRIGIHCPATAL
jgi:hypothetical protein